MVRTVGLLMAGGRGTRLYPASRSHRPKQFCSFGGDRSLLRRAADRTSDLDSVYAVTRSRYADRVREIVPEATVLTEPTPKDTGPALVYAAHEIADREDDPVLLCLPSDHVVGDGFEADARTALRTAAQTGGLVTMGIEPTRPATGYGYIRPGDFREGYAPVQAFHEKPDRDTAEQYVEKGYRWNAGIFAWRPEALLRAARETPLDPLVAALESGDPQEGFDVAPSISIDHGVLTRAENVFVVSAAFPWDDLGSWDALGRLLDGENAVLGEATTMDASGNVIATDEKHVSVVGVDDVVVAAYDDRVLVVPTDQAQRVRDLVSVLEETSSL
ncbi:MAG: mannose-1-phosphate guanylyltransferase [Halodesulfurarchaeum sp.]